MSEQQPPNRPDDASAPRASSSRHSGRRNLDDRSADHASARRTNFVRLTRTIVLGALALGAAVVWLGDQYGIEREVIYEFLSTSALFVGVLVVAGAVGAALLLLLRRLFGAGD